MIIMLIVSRGTPTTVSIDRNCNNNSNNNNDQ